MDHKTFIEILSKKINAGKDETSDMIGALCHVLTEAALEGDTVTFPGFGSFEPHKRIERIAKHPSNGKRMLIPPKITLTFKPSTLLKQKVRNHE
ncbi:MAG: HU family DNA-binding protein [Muribaculaceae bacterium]|nr:HU family DNA-binding protein [Muribaculaceae bacterium]MDE6523010.1 HU family DNA-binding protein [Muribaculaceae bacterium]